MRYVLNDMDSIRDAVILGLKGKGDITNCTTIPFDDINFEGITSDLSDKENGEFLDRAVKSIAFGKLMSEKPKGNKRQKKTIDLAGEVDKVLQELVNNGRLVPLLRTIPEGEIRNVNRLYTTTGRYGNGDTVDTMREKGDGKTLYFWINGEYYEARKSLIDFLNNISGLFASEDEFFSYLLNQSSSLKDKDKIDFLFLLGKMFPDRAQQIGDIDSGLVSNGNLGAVSNMGSGVHDSFEIGVSSQSVRTTELSDATGKLADGSKRVKDNGKDNLPIR
ncbi:MAG: hypothetical protein IKM97_05915 [Clostridia bacterium]|nr:hypothetical protein [Clostridia bacterium]